MKPTPGPYKVHKADYFGGYVVRGADSVIAASFSAHDTGWEQARANAEAWISGVAAMADLDEIRRAYNKPNSSFDEFMMVVRKVLGP